MPCDFTPMTILFNYLGDEIKSSEKGFKRKRIDNDAQSDKLHKAALKIIRKRAKRLTHAE